MMKCVKFIACLSILIMLTETVHGVPQDIQDAAILAFAQVKDTIDNGAAASDKKEFEFFGAKVKNEMGVGFGDAVRSKRSSQASKASVSPKSLENNLKRAKRSAHNENKYGSIINSKEKFIAKRAADYNGTAADNSVDYDYSFSSSSSSSESQELLVSAGPEETNKQKRSVGLEQFADDMKKLYVQKK